MEEKKIICPECATENESIYEYCKNCGTPIKINEPQPEPQPQPQPQTYSYNAPVNNFALDMIDGNPTADVAAFVGKKSNKFITKFSKMEITDSKISWCWPAALLGFFIGPMGSALWFLYRKMYKIGAILMAIGFALGALNWAFFGMPVPHEEMFGSIGNALQEGVFDFSFFKDFVTNETFDAVDTIICFAAGLFGGLFGTYIYKGFAKNKINRYRIKCSDMQYYSFGLSAMGGVSGGALTIGIAAYIILDDILTYIPKIMELIF